MPAKQKTLKGFIAYPPGLKDPLVQASLHEFTIKPNQSTGPSFVDDAPAVEIISDSDSEEHEGHMPDIEAVKKTAEKDEDIRMKEGEDSDEEDKHAVKAASKKIKKRVAVESDEEDDEKPTASSSNGTKLSKPESDSKLVKKVKTSSSPEKKNEDSPAKPVHPMFAPKPKLVPKETSTASSSKVSKGKEKKFEPLEEEDDINDFVVADHDEDEEENSDEEAAQESKQLASIFTKNYKAAAAEKEYPEWKEGTPVPYAALIKCLMKIEATTKRLEIISYLTEFFLLVAKRCAKAPTVPDKGKKKPDPLGVDLLKVVYLCINRLCPDYDGLELGIGESLLIKAIASSTGRTAANIKADLNKQGDLGLVAMASRSNQPTMFKPKALTVTGVFDSLTEIAKTTGNASQTKKIGIINRLLSACQGGEAKFIIRALEGKLRIGLAGKTVTVALAQAIALMHLKGNEKDESVKEVLEHASEVVKGVYSELPTYDLIIPALMEGGIDGLKSRCKLTPGIPLKPMLAKPTKAITEVLDRFEGKKFTCEYKYDGERAQIHRLKDGSLVVYSRNSENMSAKYPDLIDQLPRAIKESVVEFVLDCEAVAWDKVERRLLPFQELTKRKRKDVKAEDITIACHMFAFDILYLNGESLLHKPLIERRAILAAHFTPVEGEFSFAKASDGDSSEEIQQFLDESIKDGCEGLMVKMLETEDSTYEPSRRSMNWLKLKKDYLKGVGDSLDLVVIGAYFGKGKRTNVYGAFLLACYDPDTENYQSVCKVGTGLSDEALLEHSESLKKLVTAVKRSDIKNGAEEADVWFEPEMVWEVLVADLSLSPKYEAAKGLIDERGISLRFPRFIRVRDDKGADDATTGEQIADMYKSQAVVSGAGKFGKKGGDDGDDMW